MFVGIGKKSWVAIEGKHYTLSGQTIVFKKPPGATVDAYSLCAWPERFTHEEMAERRRECNTFNEWDSQYQLHAKPVTESRLNPEKIIPYSIDPVIKVSNRKASMWLGNVRIVGAAAYWDPSLGKIKSDASAFSVILTDSAGRMYHQVCLGVTGNIDDQCKEIKKEVIKYSLGRIEVEVNGPGGHVPHILRKHLKGLDCAVIENFETTNKNKRILDAWEAPIDGGYMWAHVDVLEGPLWDQMQDWNPEITDQPDDYLDSGRRRNYSNTGTHRPRLFG